MRFLSLAVILVVLFSCQPQAEPEAIIGEGAPKVDYLSSWHDGAVKQSILDYVKEVSTEGNEAFIPVADRIAVFDNDGTLWAEQPMYFQLIFAMDEVKRLAPNHPEWENQEPYRWILNDDHDKLKGMGLPEILEIVKATHASMASTAFDEYVKDWFASTKHPTTDKPFTKMVYEPMLELLELLRDHEFKVYIVSGGGVDFIRVGLSEVYQIPSENIIGTTFKTAFVYSDTATYIERLPEIFFINDKEGKPENIQRIIGKKPVFCAGNSDGDLAMMRYTDSNNYKSYKLYVHHTDSIREWAYDSLSSIGHFQAGLIEAKQKDWTLVDMKKDWIKIFPEE